MKKSKKAERLTQMLMLGITTEKPRRPNGVELLPFDFKGLAVRVLTLGGEPWWVLSDVARALGYETAKDAGRCLRDKHKGRHSVPTPGGSQQMITVSEAGLYRLMMRSERPEAEAFQDWITDEVIPTIRKTGSYSVTASPRVKETARRLRCDLDTAKVRTELRDLNASFARRLADRGATPRDLQNYHNSRYLGRFGVKAPRLRELVGQTSCRQTPLDRMDFVHLAALTYGQALTDKALAALGRPASPAEVAEVHRNVMEAITAAESEGISAAERIRLVKDPVRGRVIAGGPAALN